MNKLTLFFACIFFSFSVSATTITVIGDKKSYFPYQEIKLKFDVSSFNTNTEKWWIGLFEGSDSSDTSSYKTYKYLGKNFSGELVLKSPVNSGEYHLKLIDSNYVEKGSNRIPFKVESIKKEDISIVVPSTIVDPGSKINATITSTKPTVDLAWLGLFPASVERGKHSGYSQYHYMKGKTQNTFTFNVPEKKGDYELRYFSTQWGEEVTHLTLNVGSKNEVSSQNPVQAKNEKNTNINRLKQFKDEDVKKLIQTQKLVIAFMDENIQEDTEIQKTMQAASFDGTFYNSFAKISSKHGKFKELEQLVKNKGYNNYFEYANQADRIFKLFMTGIFVKGSWEFTMPGEPEKKPIDNLFAFISDKSIPKKDREKLKNSWSSMVDDYSLFEQDVSFINKHFEIFSINTC